METEDLNNRQKVVISFMMGRFVQETIQGQLRSIEKSTMEMHDHPPEVGG